MPQKHSIVVAQLPHGVSNDIANIIALSEHGESRDIDVLSETRSLRLECSPNCISQYACAAAQPASAVRVAGNLHARN
jgi:hypothetical protein